MTSNNLLWGYSLTTGVTSTKYRHLITFRLHPLYSFPNLLHYFLSDSGHTNSFFYDTRPFLGGFYYALPTKSTLYCREPLIGSYVGLRSSRCAYDERAFHRWVYTPLYDGSTSYLCPLSIVRFVSQNAASISFSEA